MSAILTLWMPLVSAAIGGGLALTGAFAIKLWEERQRRLSIREALAAEMSSLIALATQLNFADNYLQLSKKMRMQEQRIVWRPFGTDAALKMSVYESVLKDIGSIGPGLAPKVVQFYMAMTAVRVRLRAMEDGTMDGWTNTQVADQISEGLALWGTAERIARELIPRMSR